MYSHFVANIMKPGQNAPFACLLLAPPKEDINIVTIIDNVSLESQTPIAIAIYVHI